MTMDIFSLLITPYNYSNYSRFSISCDGWVVMISLTLLFILTLV